MEQWSDTGLVCIIQVIGKALAKSISSVRKLWKLRLEQAGQSSPVCKEQGTLAPGAGLLSASGTTAALLYEAFAPQH